MEMPSEEVMVAPKLRKRVVNNYAPKRNRGASTSTAATEVKERERERLQTASAGGGRRPSLQAEWGRGER